MYMSHLRLMVLNQMEECNSIKRVNMCVVYVLQAKEADNIIKLLRKDQNKVCFNPDTISALIFTLRTLKFNLYFNNMP